MSDTVVTVVFFVGLAAIVLAVLALGFGVVRWGVEQIAIGLGLRGGDRHE